jgi:hypothetical protein
MFLARKAIQEQTMAMKALAVQMSKMNNTAADQASHPSQPAPTRPKISYKDAVQTPKIPRTIQKAQTNASIAIKAKADMELNRPKILELIRKHARDESIKANFTIHNNAGPNLIVKPDAPEDTAAIRKALTTCLAKESCEVAGPLTPRLIVFNIDNQTSTEEVVQAINSRCDKNVATLHKVHDLPESDSYHAFIDIPGDCLLKLFPEGGYKTKLKVNMTILNLEISKNVRICFRCGRFGHTAARCTSEEARCIHCAGAHQLKDCPVKSQRNKKNCLNCHTASHAATDFQCPAYKKQFLALMSKFF